MQETLDTPGWKEILGPLLDKAIESQVGQKDKNGIWVAGEIDKRPEYIQYYLGYKAGLMDYSNSIYNHLLAIVKAKSSIEELDKVEDRKETTTAPMEDTKYV